MSHFIVTRKSDGVEMTRYSAATAQEVNGFDFIGFDHVEYDPEVPAPVVTKRRLTKLEFVERLGDVAFVTILQMAKASPAVEGWVEKMKITTPDPDGTSVNLDDPRTIAGVEAIGMALEAQGVVAAGWAEGVLNG